MSFADDSWQDKSAAFAAQIDQIKSLQDALDKANGQLAVFSENDNEKNATTQKIIDMFAEKNVPEYAFIKVFQELVLKIRKREASYEAILNLMETEETQKTFSYNYALETASLGAEIPRRLGPFTNYFKQVSGNNANKALEMPYTMHLEMFELLQALAECNRLARENNWLESYDLFLKYLKGNEFL